MKTFCRKLWSRFTYWLRWKIAHHLDRYPGFCWAKLVALAENWEVHDLVDVLELHRSAGWCARHGEVAYCGKCNVTGLHSRLGGPVLMEELRIVGEDDPHHEYD